MIEVGELKIRGRKQSVTAFLMDSEIAKNLLVNNKMPFDDGSIKTNEIKINEYKDVSFHDRRKIKNMS